MNEAQRIFQDMMKLPDHNGKIKGPSHTKTDVILRTLFRGTPKGKRFYFNMKRPLLRDAVVVIDVPPTWDYKRTQQWIDNLYRNYVVSLHPNRWEYIWHWDDYEVQRYRIYKVLESRRNPKDFIRLDEYYKIKNTFTGTPSKLFGWINYFRKEGVNKNPLGLVERKSRFKIRGRLYEVYEIQDGGERLELILKDEPRPGESIRYEMKMKDLVDGLEKSANRNKAKELEKN